MIATKDRQAVVSGNMTGTKVAMRLAAGQEALIMGFLTDLYSDPEQAIIREYSTNASDSHIEAGIDRPIEVWTPTAMAPFFKVRDFGVGLDAEGIANIYSQYGASTKRETNDQSGTFGLGCKSALAYTSQFTIVGVKGGVRTQVVVSRDEEGAGHMTIVSETATTDPSGVEIVVPVKSMNQIKQKAEAFFKFWPAGSVKLDGAEPPKVQPYLRLSDDLYIRSGQGQDQIVMGHVPYPQPIVALPYNLSLVANVPMGSVTLPPARESLIDTATTRETITKVRRDFERLIKPALQAEVDRCDTRPEALARSLDLTRQLGSGHGPLDTWRGEKLPTTFGWPAKTGQAYDQGPFLLLSRSDGYRMSKADQHRTVHTQFPETAIFVEGYDPVNFTATHKKKLRQYMVENPDMPHAVTFVMTTPSDPLPADQKKWINPDRFIQWADVAALKLPKAAPRPKSSTHLSGSYSIWTSDETNRSKYSNHRGYVQHQTPADKLTGEILWLHGTAQRQTRYFDPLHAYAVKAGATINLVCLPENRIAKFQRDFPKAKRLSDKLAEIFKAWTDGLTKDQKAAIAQSERNNRDVLLGMDATKVNDPAIKEAIRIAHVDIKALHDTRYQWSRMGFAFSAGPAVQNPLDKYPLFNYSVLRRDPKHVYRYLNDAYAASI